MEIRDYFVKMGLPGPKPWFILGNFIGVIKKGLNKHDLDIIQKYGKTIGYFEAEEPVILTTDVKFIKAVMIKDFGYFINRRVCIQNHFLANFIFQFNFL